MSIPCLNCGEDVRLLHVAVEERVTAERWVHVEGAAEHCADSPVAEPDYGPVDRRPWWWPFSRSGL